MARVFLGRDEVLDRPVAVKVLKPMHGDTDIGVRFRREGRTAARLSHPNIVQVYDAGEGDLDDEEVSYIVMEYLSGGDLKERIDGQGKLPEGDLARFGEEVCAGLAHAHGRGIIHRDIKPHNILLDEKGRAKVSDFGIARALDTTQATRTGAYLGTALYSSPEQLQGHKVTFKSDVYSLGATLYQAATGGPPFVGTPIEVASQHVSKPPPPLYGADVGEELRALILSCLAKNAEDRPSTEQALSRFASISPTSGTIEEAAPAAAPPPKPRRQSPRPAPTVVSSGRTRRRGLAGGVVAALALLAVLGVIGAFTLPTLLSSGSSTGQTDTRQDEQAEAQGSNAGGGSQEDQGSQEQVANAGDTGGGNASNEDRGSQDTGNGDRGSQQGAGNENEGSQNSGSNSDSRENEPAPAEPDGGLTAEAAEQTVREHYEVAASDDYPNAWNYLSSSYQEEWGSPGAWTSQFRTLESVRFTTGPTAEVDGNTAFVSFSTVAQHTDRTDRPSLTATLINEGGEWKIDSI